MLHTKLASEHNNMLIQETNLAWSLITDDLLCGDGYSEQQRNAKLRNWFSTCCSSDYAAIIGTCKRAYDLLIDIMSKQIVDVTYVDFKGQLTCMGLTPALIGMLFAPISDQIKHCLSSKTTIINGVYRNDCVKSLKICSYFLSFPKKINFLDVGLEDKALQDYISLEERNRNISFNDDIICDLRSIITDWFKDYRYDFSLVRHGKGAVSDAKVNKASKYSSFCADSKISYFLKSQGPFDVSSDSLDVVKQLYNTPGSLSRTSKLVFVPKDVTKVRSISMEPAGLQYLQQAAFRSISRYMSHHKIGQHIALSDQSQNRALAYDGSITNCYATLDLSSASDTVIWSFVKKIFGGCPALLRVLYCTRSTHTLLPSGDGCELIKFAPMGSALCFPIESIVFAAIAKLAIKRSKRNHQLVPKTQSTFFSVFGDDIILPCYAAEECSSLLDQCGFILNQEKSYLDGPFKESCGGNYFCGHDITGLKFKPDFQEKYNKNISPGAHDALITYANMAYTSGFKVFRCYCIHALLDAGHKPVFGSDISNSGQIFSPAPTNFHLRTRVNRAYQRDEVLATVTTPVKVRNDDWELGMYSEWCLRRPSDPQGLWFVNKHGGYSLNIGHAEKHDQYSSRTTCFRLSWVESTTNLSTV